MNLSSVQMDQNEEEVLSFEVSDEVSGGRSSDRDGHAFHAGLMHRRIGVPILVISFPQARAA